MRTQVGAVHAVVEGRLKLRLPLHIGESQTTSQGATTYRSICVRAFSRTPGLPLAAR